MAAARATAYGGTEVNVITGERIQHRQPHQIEITPEMIEAGVEIFRGYDPRTEMADVVREIFRQMAQASRWLGDKDSNLD